jgi:hypothetical protein
MGAPGVIAAARIRMAFILSSDISFEIETLEDLQEFRRRHDAYRAYLMGVRDLLPASAFSFATAVWRDSDDHRNPHDAWVESLTILEPSSGKRHEERSLEIHLRLLGAYHDGHMALTYRDVQSYTLNTPVTRLDPPLKVGHGDWLVDEVTLSENKLVQHEIEFRRGGRWRIECRDIEWAWHPKA